jgi:hypothetical protein
MSTVIFMSPTLSCERPADLVLDASGCNRTRGGRVCRPTTPGKVPAMSDPMTPDKPERDRATEEKILQEAEGSPTLPEGQKKPRPGDASAKGLGTGAEGDLTEPGNRPED